MLYCPLLEPFILFTHAFAEPNMLQLLQYPTVSPPSEHNCPKYAILPHNLGSLNLPREIPTPPKRMSTISGLVEESNSQYKFVLRMKTLNTSQLTKQESLSPYATYSDCTVLFSATTSGSILQVEYQGILHSTSSGVSRHPAFNEFGAASESHQRQAE